MNTIKLIQTAQDALKNKNLDECYSILLKLSKITGYQSIFGYLDNIVGKEDLQLKTFNQYETVPSEKSTTSPDIIDYNSHLFYNYINGDGYIDNSQLKLTYQQALDKAKELSVGHNSPITNKEKA